MDFLDLIDVKFIESTNYINIDNQDILGCLIDYHWGPANQLIVLDKQTFFELYPESIPVGALKVDASKYEGYAQIKKAFQLGISKVEVFRQCMTGKWKYQQVNIASAGSVTSPQSNYQFDNTAFVSISTVYPGYIPQSMVAGYENVAVRMSYQPSGNTIKVEVLGKYHDSDGNIAYSVLETFEGVASQSQYDEGQNISIEYLTEQSQFIRVKVNDNITAPANPVVENTYDFALFNPVGNTEYINPDDATENATIIQTLNRYYDDFDLSSCTLLIPPYSYDGKNTDGFDLTIQNIAARRKNLNAVIGYPIDLAFTKSSIEDYWASIQREKFTFFVVGREQVSLFGSTIEINGVGGWCGSTAKVAKDVRINQLASARTYGSYVGTLTQSLSFGEVLDLHNSKGVISIYRTKQGPQIFGVRSQYKRQTSYFGKANVMRVVAMLLRNVFPVVLDGIHTDVAAEPTSMNNMEVSLQSIMDDFIANKNLKPQSKAICDNSVNTDYTTHGGTIFNAILSCYFIGLTENINIKVVATDSSVTAEIVE